MLYRLYRRKKVIYKKNTTIFDLLPATPEKKSIEAEVIFVSKCSKTEFNQLHKRKCIKNE